MTDNTSGGEQPQTTETSTEIATTEVTQQAQQTTQVEATTETKEPTVQEALAQIDLTKLTEEQVQDFESGDPIRIAKLIGIALPEEKKPTAPEQVQQPSPTTDQPTHQKSGGPDRVSLKAIEDPGERIAVAQALGLVREGKHPNLKSALVEVFKLNGSVAEPAAPATVTAAATTSKEGAPDTAVAPKAKELEGKIADLEKQKASALSVYEYETAMQLGEQIADLKGKLQDATHQAATQQTTEQQFVQLEQVSRAKAIATYDTLFADPNSEFANDVDAAILLAESKDDPILYQPDWPEKITQRVYDRLYKGKTDGNHAADQTTEAKVTIPPAPDKGIRLPGAPAGSHSTTQAVTGETALAEFDRLSPDEQQAILSRL